MPRWKPTTNDSPAGSARRVEETHSPVLGPGTLTLRADGQNRGRINTRTAALHDKRLSSGLGGSNVCSQDQALHLANSNAIFLGMRTS
jgi:hypothetical protein